VKAGKIAEFAARGTSRANDSLALEEISKRGMQIYFPTPAEKRTFRDAAQKPVVEWLKKNVDAKLVDQVLASVGE
jgi:TRAP-type transport system periplasmic protein